MLDPLPERVPAESPGRFFEVEELFRDDAEEAGRLARSVRRIVLKLACYFRVEALDFRCEEWMDVFHKLFFSQETKSGPIAACRDD